MNSNEDKIYIKILALSGIYNFVVDKFLILKLFKVQNSFKLTYFKIWILQFWRVKKVWISSYLES